jgi:diguanylate cyclase (GGDEF)-like protein
MHIDLPTMMIAGSFVSAVSGVFLIFAAMQTKGSGGMLWWASANLTMATAIPLIAFNTDTLSMPSVVVAITLLNLSPALVWASAQAVDGKRPDVGVVGSGAAVWLVAYTIPAIRHSIEAQVSLNLAIASIFIFAAAYEFWRGRDDRLTARWPLIVLLILHGMFSAGGAVAAAAGALTPINGTALLTWIGFVHFETLAFVVGTSIFTVAMARERQELLHKITANTDSLTGLSTRRAFYERAALILEASRDTGAPVAVILFDLDAFKTINDTYGHGPGDEVLRTFGQSVRKMLRSTDLIGRLGGEEFGAMLPGASLEAAYVVAERTRVAFTAACRTLGDLDTTVSATVSAGVARAEGQQSLDSLLKAADEALYRAKTKGRNRVELAARRGAAAPAPPAIEQVA